MRNQTLLKLVSSAMTGGVLAGCMALPGSDNVAKHEKDFADRKRLSGSTAAVGAGANARPSFAVSETAFITSGKTGAAQRVAEEKALPASFTLPLAMRFGPAPVSAARVFRELETELQMPMRLAPDVFIPQAIGAQSNLQGALAANTGNIVAQQGAAQNVVMQPTVGPYGGQPGLSAGAQLQQQGVAQLPPMELNVSGTRRDVLKVIASKLGLEFDYIDGEIIFSRFVNRTFYLEGSPRNISSSDTFGAASSGSGAAGAATASSSASNTLTIESNVKVFDDLEAQLKAIKSPQGVVVLSKAQGSVLVRDTKRVADEAAAIVDKFNSMMSRQVLIEMDVITLTSDKGAGAGFDLSLAFQKYVNGLPDALVTMKGPASLVANGGSLIFTVNPGAGGTSNPRPMNGSKVVIDALSEFGYARTLHKSQGYTRNNTPLTFEKQKQRSYIDQITPAPAGGSGTSAGSPGITQATVTTGFLSRVYPTILSGNRVLLDTVLANSNLDDLVQASNGTNMVQSPDVSRYTTVSLPIVPSGAFVAFQAYEREIDQDKSRTGLLGLSRSGSTALERTIVVMRATIQSVD